MGDWIYLKHPEAGETRVPDAPGVLDSYLVRGWEQMPDPGPEAAFVPPKAVAANEDDGWVELYHPIIKTTHLFPSHPDAVQGAYESGWQATTPQVSEPAPALSVDNSEKAPAKPKPKKPEPATPAADEGE